MQVPSGLCAVVYEHADDGGGYGISIDVLNDCPNLSVCCFNDKVSYIDVFPTAKCVELRDHRGDLKRLSPLELVSGTSSGGSPFSHYTTGGTQIFIVGSTIEDTYAIRPKGRRITYDTTAPGSHGAVRAHVKFINEHLTERSADWWIGTHGMPEGELGGKHLEKKSWKQECAYRHYQGYHVNKLYRGLLEAALSTPIRPTVYAWCFSSSRLVP
ncbi:hypothetical protein [Microvirga aerophila]|uniref:hypothetical protein n=1 Tax=Microvirga aerophila TaxID=670291 RepID=UPI0011BDCEE0|nr:hypothetical protein [Microvirga aerophila]